jgi:hypothetical protein
VDLNNRGSRADRVAWRLRLAVARHQQSGSELSEAVRVLRPSPFPREHAIINEDHALAMLATLTDFLHRQRLAADEADEAIVLLAQRLEGLGGSLPDDFTTMVASAGARLIARIEGGEEMYSSDLEASRIRHLVERMRLADRSECEAPSTSSNRHGLTLIAGGKRHSRTLEDIDPGHPS